jgi:hypothetical protein
MGQTSDLSVLRNGFNFCTSESIKCAASCASPLKRTAQQNEKIAAAKSDDPALRNISVANRRRPENPAREGSPSFFALSRRALAGSAFMRNDTGFDVRIFGLIK